MKLTGLISRFLKFRRRTGLNKAPKDLNLQVEKAQQAITGAMSSLESLFVAFSEQFTQICESCQSMVEQCEKLRELASGKNEGATLMQEVVKMLHDPMVYIDDCMRRQEQLVILLKQSETQTLEMLKVRDSMRNVLTPLSFISVQLRIESAQLSADLREAFVSVTEESDSLRLRVEASFAKNTELLGQAHVTLAAVRAKLEIELKQNVRFLAEKRTHIEKAIQQMDAQLTQNAERDTRLHSVSKALSQQVSSVVMGLQFQDIIKQKCDHVAQSLGTLDLAAEHASSYAGLNSCHLESVEKDLDEGLKSIESGIGQIQHQVNAIERSSLKHDDIEGMTASVKGLVQLLLDTTTDITEIISLVLDITRQSHENIKPAGEVAQQLSTTLVDLALTMKLIAINAQLRGVQHGKGTGLEVIAARAAAISEEMSEISRATTYELSHLQSAINELLSSFAEFHKRGEHQLAQLGQERIVAEKRLHGHRDESIRAITALGTGVDTVHAAITQLTADLNLVPEVKAKVSKAALTLRKIHELTGGEIDQRHLEAHASRYTMASEHAVHATLTGTKSAKQPDQSSELF